MNGDDELEPWQRELTETIIALAKEGKQVLFHMPPQHRQSGVAYIVRNRPS